MNSPLKLPSIGPRTFPLIHVTIKDLFTREQLRTDPTLVILDLEMNGPEVTVVSPPTCADKVSTSTTLNRQVFWV